MNESVMGPHMDESVASLLQADVTCNGENTPKTDANSEEMNVPKGSWFRFKTPLIWHNIIMITAIHILAVYALLTHNYTEETWKLALYGTFIGLLAGFGVTAGAHRLWSHRSYKANLPLRIFLMLCFTSSGQNSLVEWVKDHRVHHKYTETDADPHDSRRGFFFSHVGWLMMRKHPEVIRKGRAMDFSDLYKDPVIVFHEKYYWPLKFLFWLILPTAIPPLCWGETWYNSFMTVGAIKYVLSLNFTWSVNSAAHFWGYKPYDRRIKPSENGFVSLVALGEGWHNYHHTFPWDYRASELGYHFNLTTFLLDMFAKIGWVYDRRYPSDKWIKNVAEKHGDGTVYSTRED